MKKTLSIILVCILLLSIFSCSGSSDEGVKNDPTYIDELARKIYIGQTYADVCEVLGSEGVDAASGMKVYEWDFGVRGKITITFKGERVASYHVTGWSILD